MIMRILVGSSQPSCGFYPQDALIARSLTLKDVCLVVCRTPVLCLNGQTYLKTFDHLVAPSF